MPRPAVVIPVKAFGRAKMRLAEALDPPTRRQLARRLAAGVIKATAGWARFVVCDDEEVRGFAEAHGAGVLWTPGTDLNGAVTAAVDELGGRGVTRVVVTHADLPHPRRLAAVIDRAGRHPGVTLVPDREGRGTNVLAVPTGVGFGFAYGPDSCARHRAEAARLGLAVDEIRDDDLGLDLDRPDDLDLLDRPVRAEPPTPAEETRR